MQQAAIMSNGISIQSNVSIHYTIAVLIGEAGIFLSHRLLKQNIEKSRIFRAFFVASLLLLASLALYKLLGIFIY